MFEAPEGKGLSGHNQEAEGRPERVRHVVWQF